MTRHPDPEKLRIIVRWLGRLAAIVRTPADFAEDHVKTLALLLEPRFRSNAFNADSLAHVALSLPYWPALAEIDAALAAWPGLDAGKPLALAAPREPQDDLGGYDRAWWDYWQTRKAEIAGGLLDPHAKTPSSLGAGRATAPLARKNLASLVREQSPKAWALISGGNS